MTLQQHSDTEDQFLLVGSGGDSLTWAEVVARYEPLILAITRRYRLPDCDAGDVSQYVWLQLLTQGTRLRDPRALPGWISTTATRRCLELLRSSRRAVAVDPTVSGLFNDEVEPLCSGAGNPAALDHDLLRDEQGTMVRRALDQLSDSQREMVLMLVADPPLSYREIGARLHLPVGSIGPTRARLLKKLRRILQWQLGGEQPTSRSGTAA